MTGKKMLGPQIKILLTEVSDRGKHHLMELETDLVQAGFLIGEAVEKLGANFLALHSAINLQQKEIESLLSELSLNNLSMERLHDLRGEINRYTNEAVTGLQFQDLTSQLLARTVKRIAGLHNLLNELAAGVSALSNVTHESEIVEILDEMNKRLSAQSANLRDSLRKVVHQKDMGSGDIEMF
jgi:hypothetical protein